MISRLGSSSEEDVVSIIREMTEIKSSVINYLQEHYQNFNDVSEELKSAKVEFQDLKTRSDNVIKKAEDTIKELSFTGRDYQNFQVQIRSVKEMKKVVDSLLKLYLQVEQLSRTCEDQLTLDIKKLNLLTDECVSLSTRLSDKKGLKLENFSLFVAVQKSVVSIRLDLRDKAEKLFDNYVVCGTTGSSASFSVRAKLVELEALLRLLTVLQSSNQHLEETVNYLAEAIIYPVISNPNGLKLILKKEEESFTIRLCTDSMCSSNVMDSNKINEAKLEVLDSLCECLECLNDSFLSLSAVKSQTPYYFGDKLCQAIILNFFNPLHESQLFLDHAVKIDSIFKKSGLVSLECRLLIDLVENFDSLVSQSQATTLLKKARSYFLIPLIDNFVSIMEDPISDKDKVTFCTHQVMKERTLDKTRELLKHIDLSKITFPPCKISVSVWDMMGELRDQISFILQEAETFTNPEEALEKMSELVRVLPQLFELYILITPVSNRQFLRDSPTAVAIHYNNCQFLAHYCLFWPVVFRQIQLNRRDCETDIITELESASKTTADSESGKNDSEFCFTKTQLAILQASHQNLLPTVYRLRSESNTTLQNELKERRNQIADIFDEYKSNLEGIGSTTRKKVESALNKIVRLLGSLSKDYEPLPQKLYDKVLGDLTNFVIQNFVNQILHQTDITTKDCLAIIEVLSVWTVELELIFKFGLLEKVDTLQGICTKTPTLDEEKLRDHVLKHVPQMKRLLDVRYVMESTLLDVEQSWSAKKLSSLQSEELRGLIKALFKNNSTRASILAKIV